MVIQDSWRGEYQLLHHESRVMHLINTSRVRSEAKHEWCIYECITSDVKVNTPLVNCLVFSLKKLYRMNNHSKRGFRPCHFTSFFTARFLDFIFGKKSWNRAVRKCWIESINIGVLGPQYAKIRFQKWLLYLF